MKAVAAAVALAEAVAAAEAVAVVEAEAMAEAVAAAGAVAVAEAAAMAKAVAVSDGAGHLSMSSRHKSACHLSMSSRHVSACRYQSVPGVLHASSSKPGRALMPLSSLRAPCMAGPYDTCTTRAQEHTGEGVQCQGQGHTGEGVQCQEQDKKYWKTGGQERQAPQRPAPPANTHTGLPQYPPPTIVMSTLSAYLSPCQPGPCWASM